eukprot:CAMPEP_0183522728 /NCGR_PEP_ID=MMETSP0371-20130417/18648_1 /TAXON_ID=268820 /ORGANISM="Peridinium aciculiferum, Strain PAER-2" /LENGTH=136 /DNA_ID=CAMNT_0025721543 /DNA_START=18 /DNA_END=429 /DNA_ORIENTATION=-
MLEATARKLQLVLQRQLKPWSIHDHVMEGHQQQVEAAVAPSRQPRVGDKQGSSSQEQTASRDKSPPLPSAGQRKQVQENREAHANKSVMPGLSLGSEPQHANCIEVNWQGQQHQVLDGSRQRPRVDDTAHMDHGLI